jgi:hypothetical protein
LTEGRHRTLVSGSLLFTLLLGEFLAYSPSMNGFFFGDSLAIIINRPRTFAEAIGTFGEVIMWYRPLTQPLAHYVLFPLFGFHFLPYHLIALSLHMLVSALLYFALLDLTGDDWSAFMGAGFFGLHSIGFYATYDSAFFSDPVLVGAFVGAIWSFLRHRFGVAAACLCIGLVSKEAAVTMVPMFVILVVATGDYRKQELRKPLIVFSTVVVVLLAAYFAIYAPHFNLQGRSLISNQRADYALSLQDVPEHFRNYVSWIFHIPRTWMTEHWVAAKGNMLLHAAFATGVGIFALLRMIRKDARVGLGMLLFLIPALPTLMTRPFVHHAYVPLLGAGVIVACLFLAARPVLPRSAFAAISIIFLSYQGSITYRNVRRDNVYSWVGAAANHARQASTAFESVKGRLQANTELVIVNQTTESRESIDFSLGGVTLPRLVAGNENLTLRVIDGGTVIDSTKAVVFDYDGKVLSARGPQ